MTPTTELAHLCPLPDRILFAVLAGCGTPAQVSDCLPDAGRAAVDASVAQLREAGRLNIDEQALALPPPVDPPFEVIPQVRDAVPPHTHEEVATAAARILLDGHRPRLLLWAGGGRVVLARCHLSAEICLRWDRAYDVSYVEGVPDIDGLMRWRGDAQYAGGA